MSRNRPVYGALLVVAACGSSAPEHETAKLEALRFDVPVTWKKSDPNGEGAVFKRSGSWAPRGLASVEWTPSDNDGKESITVIRSERSPSIGRATGTQLVPLLEQAQTSLRDVHVANAALLKTPRGFAGARVELDFTPPGRTERYHRVHVVLADEIDNSLVHILYTARTPDRELAALSMVLDTIHHGEG